MLCQSCNGKGFVWHLPPGANPNAPSKDLARVLTKKPCACAAATERSEADAA